MISVRAAGFAAAAALLVSSFQPAHAQDAAPRVKLGVLTDLSGPYSSFAGEGTVIATQMAVDDCLKAECKGGSREGFYWDFDEGTRAWSKRFAERYKKGMPSISHAGACSVTLHYLRAVAAARTTEAKAVVRKMHELPISDDIVRNASLRPDGRMVHDTYLFKVKTPAESKGEWDLYKTLQGIPGEQAFRPLSESACPAMKKS